jgi:hypothetical protein
MIWLWLVPVAAVAAAWLDLFVFPRGLGFIYRPGTPEAFPFRARRNSWLVRLVRVGRPRTAPAAGLAVGRTMHLWVGDNPPSPWLVAHEFAHLVRQRGRAPSYLARYVGDSQFRGREEKACDAWAYVHAGDSPFGTVARLVGGA